MRPVCLRMIFLLFTLPYLTIWLNINLLKLLKEPSIVKALHTLHKMTETRFLLRKSLQISCMVLSKCMWCADLLNGQHLYSIRTKLYRQVVGIPMSTNCAPLVVDLFLFCYERGFMMSLSDDKQADIIDAFNTTSNYLDDL